MSTGAVHAFQPIQVTSDQHVTVFLRPSGGGSYVRVGDAGSQRIPMPAPEVDVMVEGRASFFYLWRGEQPKVAEGKSVMVTTQRVLDWPRVAAAAAVPFALALALLVARVRRLKRDTANLEGELDEARGYASLRPGVLPRTVGAYRVLARLGTGGTATVFRVVDAFGDAYALKVPDPRFLDSPAACERFFREMEIMRGLKHPGVVRIFDYHRGDADTPPYIAQELVVGTTLRDFVEAEAPVDVSRALAITRDVADILAHAHGQGVIHRDVKPANVMVQPDGQVRVMDFGVAKATTLGTMTGTDMTLGTPAYMAPEQVNSRHATVRSDLYSLGVVLFEMLTGRLPFEEEDPYRLLVLKMRQVAPRASSLRPDVPRRVDNLVALLLQADAEKRPESAEKVSRMLALLLTE